MSPFLLEVRKGSLGSVPSPPTPSSFLRRARMGRGQELAGADGVLFKELSESIPADPVPGAREEASLVSATPFLSAQAG